MTPGQKNIACKEEVVRCSNQEGMALKGRKLLREEEVELDAQKNPGEEKEWSQDHGDPSQPASWEPRLTLVLDSSDSLGAVISRDFLDFPNCVSLHCLVNCNSLRRVGIRIRTPASSCSYLPAAARLA